ncbi:MAG: hypothetical protein HC892_08185 [Saprospiraceae bacterium]|nr:hypothetical protein [Saprospiraceae bacterium]
MRFLVWLFFFFITSPVWTQRFQCDGSFFVVMEEGNQSVLRNLWLDRDGKVQSKTILLSEPQRQYTCLGLSVADLYLYALDFDTKELLRIDVNGKVTNLGVPENLNTNLEYWAGDIMPEGRRLTVIGRNKVTGVDKEIYNINLTTPNYYAGVSSVISNLSTAITDIAVDPIRGLMLGYDKLNKQMVDLGTNVITHHNYKPVTPFFRSSFFLINKGIYLVMVLKMDTNRMRFTLLTK